jgi:Zn-dependent peptidase ImmA (M78 family)
MKPSDLNKKHQQVMKFAEWTMDKIGLKNRPKIKLTDNIGIVKQHRAYGATSPDESIWVYVGDRTPADTMRTLAHELLHAKQFEDGVAHEHMDDEEEHHIEDLANAGAGRILRDYGKKDSSIYEGEFDMHQVNILVEDALAEIGIKSR